MKIKKRFNLLLPALMLVCATVTAADLSKSAGEQELKTDSGLQKSTVAAADRIANADRYEAYLLTRFYLKLNQFEEALTVMDRYLENYPDDPFILAEKADLLQQMDNQSEEAVFGLLKRALQSYPDYYYANYLLGSFLFFRYPDQPAKIDDAAAALKKAIKNNPQFYDSYYLLGIVLSEREEFAQSNHYLEMANNLEQKVSSYYYMASNYQRLADVEGEIKVYKKILSFNPGNYKALDGLARIYMKRSDYKSVVPYLEQLWRTNPGDAKISYDYLYALFADGQDKKFMEVVRSVDISESPLLLYARALILSRTGKFDEALQFIDSLKIKDARAYLLSAEIYMQKQDYFKAYLTVDKVDAMERNDYYFSLKIQILSIMNLNQRVIDLFGLVRNQQELLGHLTISDYYSIFGAYANLDRFKELTDTVRFAAEKMKKPSKMLNELLNLLTNFLPEYNDLKWAKNSKFSPNTFLLLTFYKNRQHWDLAEALLKHLISVQESKTPGLYLELADVYMRSKDFKRTELSLKEMLTDFPKSSAVKNFYAYYLALQDKQLDYALKLSGQTLDLEPENGAYLDTYGLILLKMNRPAEAASYLRRAFDKHPFEKEIMEHMVTYYRLKKNKAAISDIYKNAVQNGVDFKDQLKKELDRLQSGE